jgi:hypothetical protein
MNTSDYRLLEENEMVYKIIGELSRSKALGLYKTYRNIMLPRQMLEMAGVSQTHEAIAKHKTNNKLYRISTHLLGYVGGGRAGGGQEGVLESPVLYGYDVLWQRKSGGNFTNFEDETLLLPLKNIIILAPEEVFAELINEKGIQQNNR